MDLLEQLCISRSLGVLLVTHDLGLVMRRANALVVLHSGHVCESGATEKVLGSPRHPYTKGLMACRLPLSTRQEPLGGLEKVMGSDEEWEPQSTPEGLLRPWRPSESTVGGARPACSRWTRTTFSLFDSIGEPSNGSCVVDCQGDRPWRFHQGRFNHGQKETRSIDRPAS